MTASKSANEIPIHLRASHRLSITVPYVVMAKLETLSHQQGRSISNCAAHYLERGLAAFAHSEPTCPE